PNGQLVNSQVLNLSRPRSAHRVAVRVGLHYRHPPNEVRRVLLRVLQAVPQVLEDMPRDCVLEEFGESSITYVLRFWIDDVVHEDEILDAIRTRVWYAADRAGLEMPFPIRTIQMPYAPAAEGGHDLADRRAAIDALELFGPLDENDRGLLAGTMRR